jgi:hypothetical protein
MCANDRSQTLMLLGIGERGFRKEKTKNKPTDFQD